MPVASGDIDFFLSGGSGNTDPDASHGGAISSTQATSNSLFDDVSASEALAGDTEYRCIYVKNSHSTDTLTAAKIFIQTNTSGNRIAIALDDNGKNATAETETDESTTPTGESFTQPSDYSSGLNLGDLAAGDYYAIWIRRIIPAAASSGTDTFTLRVQGES